MKKENFLTIFPTFENLEIVKQTLPSVVEETKRAGARLLVHDCSVNGKEEKKVYLEALNQNQDFFLLQSDNMSLAHSRNLCLTLGQELYAPEYICVLEDDHGFRPGVIDKLLNAMQAYYGKLAPNGLRFGMFTACAVHTHANLLPFEQGHLYPDGASRPFAMAGTNNCFRCAPTSHWQNVLGKYETDEYLISQYQTSMPRWRNYHKGFTAMFVDGGHSAFDVDCSGRGASSKVGLRLWDDEYCASDRRSRYIGKPESPG